MAFKIGISLTIHVEEFALWLLLCWTDLHFVICRAGIYLYIKNLFRWEMISFISNMNAVTVYVKHYELSLKSVGRTNKFLISYWNQRCFKISNFVQIVPSGSNPDKCKSSQYALTEACVVVILTQLILLPLNQSMQLQ